MIKIHGNDHFGNLFNFFKWSAPVYETPEEVIRALNKMNLQHKKIDTIRCIGGAEIRDLYSDKLYRAYVNAGMEPEDDWWEKYPNFSKMLIDRRATLCEPLQFIFTDGSTFELLPMNDGGARVSTNCISKTIVDGMNKCNIDLPSFLGDDIKGKEIESFQVEVQSTVKDQYNSYSPEKPYKEKRTSYHYIFSLGYPFKIDIKMDWECYYTIEIKRNSECDTITYQEAKACIHNVKQIQIIPGRDGGGTFWIIPTYSDNNKHKDEHSLARYDNCGISIDEDNVAGFLSEFLYRYFDISAQGEEYRSEPDEFDWYGINLYTIDNMRKMISDIRETIDLLKNDFNNPKLSDIKKHFFVSDFLGASVGKMSKEEENRAFFENREIAIDFYSRFVDSIESMFANNPDCDVISFAGP